MVRAADEGGVGQGGAGAVCKVWVGEQSVLADSRLTGSRIARPPVWLTEGAGPGVGGGVRGKRGPQVLGLLQGFSYTPCGGSCCGH